MHIYSILPTLIDLNNKTVLDIGANIGQTALSLKSIFPKSQVISYEPGKESYRFLKINRLINDLDVICINSAVVGSLRSYSLIEDEITGGRTSFLNELENDPLSVDELNINTVLLDKEISKYKPHLVKIDIEGFEWDLIKHLNKAQLKFIYFLIEIRQKTAIEIFTFFQETHKAFNLTDNHMVHSAESLEKFVFGDILFIPIAEHNNSQQT